jgi:iron(III) transport system permease protein
MGRVLIHALVRHQEPVARVACALVVLGLVAVPLAFPAAQLASAGCDAWHRALAPLASASLWTLFARTLVLAAAVTLGSLLVGVPLGVLLSRTELPGARLLFAVHALPMFLPPFLLALGWFHILGRQGIGGGPWTAGVFFGPAGVLLVLILAFSPVVTVLTALGLAAIDPSLEEAGRVAARPARVLTRLLLPLARPAIGLGALVVFSLAIAELGVPMFLRVKTYPGAVFARLGGIDYAPGEAFALVLPLLGVALGLLVLERRLARGWSFASLGIRRPSAWRAPLGSARVPVTVVAWILGLCGLMPLVGLAHAAGVDGFVRMRDWIGDSIANSLLPALGAATVTCALAVLAGHGLARRRPGTGLVDGVALLGFVTPAAVVGVGLIALWNRPASALVYRSVAILILGYLARYLVIGVRTAAVAFAQSPASLEDAAAAAGARYARRLLRIAVPLHRRGLALAFLLTLAFCLRDLEMAVLFYPPGLEPLPVRIFTLEANGPPAVVAALALTHVGLTTLVLAAGTGLLFAGARR